MVKENLGKKGSATFLILVLIGIIISIVISSSNITGFAVLYTSNVSTGVLNVVLFLVSLCFIAMGVKKAEE